MSKKTYLQAILMIALPATIIRAWSIATLWSWFIVPLGFPVIGMLHAYGLSLFVSIFQGLSDEPDLDKPASAIFARLFTAMLSPAIITGIAWLVMRLM